MRDDLINSIPLPLEFLKDIIKGLEDAKKGDLEKLNDFDDWYWLDYQIIGICRTLTKNLLSEYTQITDLISIHSSPSIIIKERLKREYIEYSSFTTAVDEILELPPYWFEIDGERLDGIGWEEKFDELESDEEKITFITKWYQVRIDFINHLIQKYANGRES